MSLIAGRYRHGVIPDLIDSVLLRNVRSEIQNLSFTPKETDIYKIHQSGDLANLDGLDDSSLKLLPSLVTLRDAMYSPEFRNYLSTITDSGPLSGKKTDMAVNVYTPGCHLLCHDDVIGSRRVSYILYLTDPEKPWQAEWGGALRLYPTQKYSDEDSQSYNMPSPDHSVSIPPAFNQLSFFAVQPGESFHDVEEVYGETESQVGVKDEGRVRMAISGWYHIPQNGEQGYVDGLESKLAEKSSLMQLQGKEDKYDLPKTEVQLYSNIKPGTAIGLPTPSSQEDLSLSENDLTFLLKFMAPTYLTPDTLESVSNIFAEECSLCLDAFMSRKFSDSLREYIVSQESQPLPLTSADIEHTTPWTFARPPHKHRFLFQQTGLSNPEQSPLWELLNDLFPSTAFQKWLSLATGHQIVSHNSLLRRFRRGHDHTLATGYEEHSPRIELCLGITPTPGWGDDQDQEPENPNTGDETSRLEKDALTEHSVDQDVGGYLAYMAGEENEDAEDDDSGSNHGIEVPTDMSTGARSTKVTNPKKAKQDPAIYQASGDDEDDGVLFSMPAGWNRLGVVLRDRGTMRFVKYVSRMAKGDRWDLVGEFGIVDDGDSEENDDDAEEDDDGAEEDETDRSLDDDPADDGEDSDDASDD